MKDYIVLTCIHIAADNPQDAVTRAMELAEESGGARAFVHEANKITEAAAEAALVDATEIDPGDLL